MKTPLVSRRTAEKVLKLELNNIMKVISLLPDHRVESILAELGHPVKVKEDERKTEEDLRTALGSLYLPSNSRY
jgi:hypothetical protein